MVRQYITYFIWFHPYIYIRSIIWIIWCIPQLSIIYSKSLAKSFLIKFQKVISWLTGIFRKSHFWNDLGRLSIWYHTTEYDVQPSKMMFKAMYMHSKPLKHAKNMRILTNYIDQPRFVQYFLQMSFFGKRFCCTRISYFACTFVWMFLALKKIQIS